MRIEIIGGQDTAAKSLHKNMEQAVLNMEFPAEVVLKRNNGKPDPQGNYGNSPAVAINGRVISEGKVLSPSECSKLLANYLVGI
jgi:hypothetical protein